MSDFIEYAIIAFWVVIPLIWLGVFDKKSKSNKNSPS